VSEPKAALVQQREANDAVKYTERRVLRKARRLIEDGILHATLIDDFGVPVDAENPPQLTKQQMRIALDLRDSKRNAKMYIDTAIRVSELALKAEAIKSQGGPVQLNIGTINIVRREEYQYPVIDVDAKDVTK
jgi:hypothetical protein